MQSFITNSHEVFIHIHQGCFAGTGAIVRLPQCQWSKPDRYGKISQCITTTKHSKEKNVCIFLGIYTVILVISVGESPRHENWITFSTHMRHTAFVGIWGYQRSRQKRLMIDHKPLSDGHERSYVYCQGPYIDIGIDFHQLWGQTMALIGWFHTIAGLCTTIPKSFQVVQTDPIISIRTNITRYCNKPFLQIQQFPDPTSHKAQFCNKCAHVHFNYKMVHCRMIV